MPRINIEDQFWTDVAEVAAKIGDSDRAVGQALKLIRFGQERFKEGRPITREEFDARFSGSLIPWFAKVVGDTIEVVGAGKHFGWLKDRQSAGRKGGQSKAKQTKAKPSKLKQVEASYSSSPSSSGSCSDSRTLPSEGTKANAFVAGYVRRFTSRWGAKVNVEGKDAGIAKRVAERLSRGEIEDYLDAFFRIPDAELIKKKHPIFLFESKINEIAVFAQTGKVTTHREAMHADNAAALATQLQGIREGRI